MTRRPDPTDCRHEPPYPDHDTVLFADHGGSDLVVHRSSRRCPQDWPHEIGQCGEFEWPPLQ